MTSMKGRTLETRSGLRLVVEDLLGAGGQGEVYRVSVDGKKYALKWYFPHQATSDQRKILEDLVQKGQPTKRFLWPVDLVDDPEESTAGYLMALREKHFKGIVDLMTRRVSPSFRALCTAGYLLADSYLRLHHKGLAYRDISFGNVFFDPADGEIRICDNDNVAVDNSTPSAVLGTPRFMAPEIVRGEAGPSADTDRFSLAVLLFYLFVQHHPLEGKLEADIHAFDLPAMNRLYGEKPVFIYDPADASNRPVAGYQDNALAFWPIYPESLRLLFTRAFTTGLSDAKNGRVMESQWRKEFVQLRDSIMYCGACPAENFYDQVKLKSGKAHMCWRCGRPVPIPMRIRLDGSTVMLNHDTKLYAHHLGTDRYNFDSAVAAVAQHPQNPSLWGLKNLSKEKWAATRPDGATIEIPPGKSASLATGLTIHFGTSDGVVRSG